MTIERLHEVAAGANASLGEVRKIAKALHVPVSAILAEESAEPIKLLFRHPIGQRTSNLTSSVAVLASQIHDVLIIAGDLPANTAWLDVFRGMEASSDSAEQFADIFRGTFGHLDDSEPFLGLPSVVESLGIFVVYARDSSVEGVSAIVDGYAFILVGPRTFRPRMLFTIAHELGHLVAHHANRTTGYAMLDLERDVDGLNPPPRRAEEQFADAFAANLILPRRGVLRALSAIRMKYGASGPLGDVEILSLARFYGVSFEAAARRCEQLELLPPRGARALYQKLVDAFGNPERRADNLGLPARENFELATSPRLLRAAVAQLRSGSLSLGRAAELLNVPASTLFAANADVGA
ncbi:ImmA/IrrE family metallo-endopeptidase [Burkholderia glumae]|uniref:ImmA/IrrE family metallo-endopeptidase n=1 Tax=Burkholderia glumae TaxID=337 RepID=UPI00215004BF|nr:ImmA/IrrE family metallo-endopeptidase [Burkholderia glumae]UVS89753.1 ImmA/IrrE family metallo-endopeptidase [Burkholderia glumae]